MPYTTHRASSALPDAGAYDTAPDMWELGPNTEEITVALTYTAGGAGGYPGLKLFWAVAGVTAMVDTVANNTLAVSAPNATVSEYNALLDCQSLLNGSGAKSLRVLKVPPGASHVQIQAREVGNTGAPGTLEVRLARRV